MPLRPLLCTCLLLPALTIAADPPQESPDGWYRQGENALQAAVNQQPITGTARNVILFVGDGMGITTITASRILAGQRQGGSGEEHVLAFERFPHVALLKTYNTNQQVPDSAGAMSAIMTGIKTQSGVLSVDQDVVRGDCKSVRGHERATLLEKFEAAGRATGIVSTAGITSATPAAAYAHSPERDWENDTDLPDAAVRAGCRDIARQLIEFGHGDGIDVILSGGRAEFLPHTQGDPEYPGHRGLRGDGRNLIAEWLHHHPDGRYVWNGAGFAALDQEADRFTRVLGLFEPSPMRYEADRAADPGGEPSLADMTAAAIRILSRNEGGYFLLVEGGRIDHALHETNAWRALTDAGALAEAVNRAAELTSVDDTLIIVTADHSHSLSMTGYATRGNPILGKVVENDSSGRPLSHPARARDGKQYTTLSFAIGPQARSPRRDLRNVDTNAPDFQQDALVLRKKDAHSGEDVPAYARGPWAHLVRGVQEQNYLYHVMRHAAQLVD